MAPIIANEGHRLREGGRVSFTHVVEEGFSEVRIAPVQHPCVNLTRIGCSRVLSDLP
jgi:hypothetical protein